MKHTQGNSVSGPERELNPWLLFAVGHLAVSLACLIQWGQPSAWARVDLFSGGYLVLRSLPVLRSILSPFRARGSAESNRERWGSTSAPRFVSFTLVLSIADVAIYLDYGHWNLTPALQRPAAQAAGLLLHLAVAFWNRWAARYHRAAFDNNAVRPALVRSGPFRYVRHPIYAGAMIQKIAAALVFGSAVGWLLAALWWVLLLRQVRLEETHLRKLFGDEYEGYARQTPAKLAPGIF
jgi:protein-S-isoprenylcysteine O-methyltransferase Ste14